jgi:hypothetical protein
LIEFGLGIVLVEANDERADAKWSHTTGLSISLLHTSYVFGDVFDCDGIFDCETVRLGFQTGFVDQYSGIGVETGKGKTDMVVDEADLGGRYAGVL